MKVLYVNHTGQVSGGEKSLLEVLRALPANLAPLVASPDGPLASAVEEAGVERVRITGTDGSLKLHPRHTTVALARMARAALEIRAAARRHHVDVVHANSIRAGLVTTLGARLGGPPTVAHVRDRLPGSRLSTLTLRALGRADAVVANSRYTAASFAEAGVRRHIEVLGNPVDLRRFDPEALDRTEARRVLSVGESDFILSLVAQITPWKGHEEAIRAVAQVRATHPRVKLLLVGTAKFLSRATRYDNRSYLERLHRVIDELGLQDRVEFLGERDDIPEILRASDAVLLPSWEEPFGRSVIEALAMRLPVIATNVGGPAEILTDGKDGLLVPPRQPDAWAAAITSLLEAPALRERLGSNGRLRAYDFAADAYSAALMDLYEALIERRELRREAPAWGQLDSPG